MKVIGRECFVATLQKVKNKNLRDTAEKFRAPSRYAASSVKVKVSDKRWILNEQRNV